MSEGLPFLPWQVHGKRRVQRWRHDGDRQPHRLCHVTIGTLDDGRWWVESTDVPHGWVYPDEAGARAKVEELLARREGWVDVPPDSTGLHRG